MYEALGDYAAQEELRQKTLGKLSHCAFLRKDANACICLPPGMPGAGQTCPHNVYVHRAELFDKRDALAGTVERLIRQKGSAELGLLDISQMDSVYVTEVLVTVNELKRQQNERERREYDAAKTKSEAESDPFNLSWNTMGQAVLEAK